jgi:teichuronic acid biosynthesis glycosyltransferase TuaC
MAAGSKSTMRGMQLIADSSRGAGRHGHATTAPRTAESCSSSSRATRAPGPLRILTVSSLFPSRARPRHGIFVETRLHHIVQAYTIDARVVAPVPWFPFRSPRFGRYAAFADTPERELRCEGRVQVVYPRYLMLPRLGVRWQPDAMAHSICAATSAWRTSGWCPDLIDAHYLYPDGVAGALLARRLGLPLVLTARGSDVNVIANLSAPRRRILGACQQADRIVTVSDGLRSSLVDLGVDAAKIVTLRNGVDADLFRPHDPTYLRQRLGLPDLPILASVGNLVPEKDQSLALRALRELPEYQLVVVGDGPLRKELVALARTLGVERRVSFVQPMPQRELADLYSSAEALLLTSSREGWPNVVVESLACGTPVIAMDVGAAREMLQDPVAGRVLVERSGTAIAAAVRDLARSATDRKAIRAHARHFDWESIARAQFELFAEAVDGHCQVLQPTRPPSATTHERQVL